MLTIIRFSHYKKTKIISIECNHLVCFAVFLNIKLKIKVLMRQGRTEGARGALRPSCFWNLLMLRPLLLEFTDVTPPCFWNLLKLRPLLLEFSDAKFLYF